MSTNRIPGAFTISGPAANGTYVSPPMDSAYEKAYFNIRFFDAAGAQATPGAGTVVVQMSPDGVNYFDVLNGAYNAADAYLATRGMPVAEGPGIRARVTLAGVTTAVTFAVTVQRY